MRDPRHAQLAKLLVTHSVQLNPGESCLIQTSEVPGDLVEAIIEAVYDAGAYPHVKLTLEGVSRSLLLGASEESLASWAACDAYQMERMDAFIGVRGFNNHRELSDVPEAQMKLYMNCYNTPVHQEIRVPKTKWVVLRYPTPSMAYMAGMSTRAFEEFYYQVTTGVDYRTMAKAMEPVKTFLDSSDRVHILGPETDLKFSIKGMTSVPCYGIRNIPDGEIYTAPVLESMQGKVAYNTPSTYQGTTFTGVSFEVKEGKIVSARANRQERIDAILDTDKGARYFGEFALGVNPSIINPMDETLFDEKIMGSFHLTPGNAYKECFNGNKSSVHWDLVSIQTPQYGGGEIWIDGVLVRRDGVFVHEAFSGLNPEHLVQA